MSYQPPPEGSGENRTPEEQARVNPSAGQDPSPTINMGGVPPAGQPPQGGYSPPPPPQGGYTPPPAGGGGYGGYGGGGTPPPAPPTGGSGFSQGDLQSVFQSWMNAVTKPNVATYENELGKASWVKVLIAVAAVAIVSAIVGVIGAAAANAAIDSSFNQVAQQLQDQGASTADIENYRNLARTFAGGGGFFSGLIGPFFSFFLGAGWLYLTSRMFGGQPSDFLRHAYLLSISYAPLRIAGAIVGLVPVLGGLVALVLWAYQLYLSGLALQAAHRMPAGRAQMAVWISLILWVLLVCLCIFLFIFVIAAAVSSTSTGG